MTYSIRSSARASKVGGISRPSALARLQVDDELKLGWLHDRQVGPLFALEDSDRRNTSLTMGVGPVYSVAHQAPGLRQIREIGNSRALCGGPPALQAAPLEPAAQETSTKLTNMQTHASHN